MTPNACRATAPIGSGTQKHSVAISGDQWHSEALSGTQWQSEALSGTRWRSVALTCGVGNQDRLASPSE